MSEFCYCVLRYDSTYEPLYTIDAKVCNNEKLVLKRSPRNGGRDKKSIGLKQYYRTQCTYTIVSADQQQWPTEQRSK